MRQRCGQSKIFRESIRVVALEPQMVYDYVKYGDKNAPLPILFVGACFRALFWRMNDFTGFTDIIGTAARISPLAGTVAQSRGTARADRHHRSSPSISDRSARHRHQAAHARRNDG